MVVPHTFGGKLNFNSHLHILVSAGGLHESEGRWVDNLIFDEHKDKLMHMWRFAVITYLRAARKREGARLGLEPYDTKHLFEEAI